MTITGLDLVLAAALGAAGSGPPPTDGTRMECRIAPGFAPTEYAMREQQVASGDQRIAPLSPQEFSAEAKQISDSLQAFFGSKEEGVPKTFATMFKHPGLYRGQMQLGLELNQHGTLPPRERELAILRVAWLVQSPFEWGEHVAYGKKLGLSSEEIERITHGSAAAGWGEHDRAVLRGVEELMCDHAVSDGTWGALAKTWNEQQLMELPGLVGAYTMTAMIYNSLRFGLLKGNDGFSQR
jgi:4-carboxymuconolactone decarboxylase